MSDLARHTARTAVKRAVQDQYCAEPRAEGHKNEVLAAAARAELPFRERTRIRIVADRAGLAEALLQHRNDLNTVPAGKVGRRENDAVFFIERAAAADADGIGVLCTESLCRLKNIL